MKYIITLFCCLLVACNLTSIKTQENGSNAEKRKAYFYKKRHPNSQKDGAPAGPIPTKFKNVTPVNHTLSRYGNPSAYRVKGRTYEVMKNPTGYRTRGLASWYGTKFHRRRTSSGEHYNMYALTAAHKTLPLPTYVRVKNLKNGRETIVKVNDRGPFHKGRVIDLSYAAAAKLGLVTAGTAPVEIEAISVGSKNKHFHYYVQAGAFTSAKLANSLKVKLTKISRSRVFVEKHKQKYVVRIGPFTNKHATEQVKRKLTTVGIPGAFSVLM